MKTYPAICRNCLWFVANGANDAADGWCRLEPAAMVVSHDHFCSHFRGCATTPDHFGFYAKVKFLTERDMQGGIDDGDNL